MRNALLLFAFCVLAIGAGCSDKRSTTEHVSTLKSESEMAQAAKDAEAAEEEVAKAAQIVKAGKRKPSSVKTNSKKDSSYVVQVGTFKVQENATKTETKLKSAGLPAFQTRIEREGGVVLYAVRIEATPDKTEAENFVASAKSATGETALIIAVEK